MADQNISKVNGKAVYVEGNDIDTDRIIPARYLKCVTFDELGPALFYDERFDGKGQSKHHVLDASEHKGAKILISDSNFGCGSSREHAPQAIQKFGFEAVIAESFAEIFHGNSTTLGIPCITMKAEDRSRLVELLKSDPEHELVIDLQEKKVICANQVFVMDMKESARFALLNAKYDPLDALLTKRAEIDNLASELGYV